MCGRLGGIDYADIASVKSGGHPSFLDVAKQRVVKLTVSIYVALENAVMGDRGRLFRHEMSLSSVVCSKQILAATRGLIFVTHALDVIRPFLLEGQLQDVYLGLNFLHRRVGRRQRRGKLSKLAVKVSELNLIVCQRSIIEHLGEGFRGSAGGQLIHRLLGNTITMSGGEFLLKLPQLFISYIVFLRGEQQAGSASVTLKLVFGLLELDPDVLHFMG